MNWRVVGQSSIGTSHLARGKECEDAAIYQVIYRDTTGPVLICAAADGAGSATYASLASSTATRELATFFESLLDTTEIIEDKHVYECCDHIYDKLSLLSKDEKVHIREFACTLLAAIIFPSSAVFMQIGDGAIVFNDGTDHYSIFVWPDNGEYLNSTSFIIEDPTFKNLKFMVNHHLQVNEVALFTDGLQHLALNNETRAAHQPFFHGLFPKLRLAVDDEHLQILNGALSNYLSSDLINNRTDDDKTLLLATRI